MAKRAEMPISDVELPASVPGGTEYSESLGRFVDNLLGAERRRRRAVQESQASFPEPATPPVNPPPSEPPPAVPKGTEDFTRSL